MPEGLVMSIKLRAYLELAERVSKKPSKMTMLKKPITGTFLVDLKGIFSVFFMKSFTLNQGQYNGSSQFWSDGCLFSGVVWES